MTIVVSTRKGDYCRYEAEYSSKDERDQAAEQSENAYKAAVEIAHEKLHPTNPIRLGLALNYSVFFYEIQNDSKKACEVAKKVSYDVAILKM